MSGKKSRKKTKKLTTDQQAIKEIEQREKEGYSLLAQLKCESSDEHRAFLLYSMQTPPNKSKVAKIFDRTSAGVGYWSKRFYWDRRRVESQTIAVECQALYRELYYGSKGESEVKQLGMWLETPVSAIPVNQDIVDKVRDIVKNSPEDPKTVREKKVRDRHLTALDASIGYLMQGIKDGSIRRTLRDLPILIQLREELGGDKSSEGNQLVVESLRVQQAKKNGGNVIQAMFEDAEELSIILKNLMNTGVKRTMRYMVKLKVMINSLIRFPFEIALLVNILILIFLIRICFKYNGEINDN